MTAPPPATEPHESRLARLVHRLEADEPAARLSATARLLMTFGPMAAIALGLTLVGLLRGAGMALFLLSVVLASLVGAGKSAVLGSAVANVVTVWLFGHVVEQFNVSSWALAGLLACTDSALCLILLANMSLLFRTSWLGIGRRLTRLHEAGWCMFRLHPWIRRMTWLGVTLFVITPLPVSGAVGGTLVARILGLSNWGTLTANAVGSLGASCLFAILGDLARKEAEAVTEHPVIALAVVALTLAVLLLLGRWFFRRAEEARRQYLASHKDETRP